MKILLAALLLPNVTFALDLSLENYNCQMTEQCAFGKGCTAASTIARVRVTGADAYAIEVSDSGEGFTEAVLREQLGDWNAYSFDDPPSFRTILVVNKDGNASMTALGSFFDEIVSLQYYGTCVAAQ